MKLSCLQENLRGGLAVVERAVASRTTLPITQNVYLEAKGPLLRLSATNLEIAITTWVGAQIEEEGSVTVPARLLSQFVNSLPAQRIDIVLENEPLRLSLKCASYEANINGHDAGDFPPIPRVDEGAVGRISEDVMRDAIRHVAFAAATEDQRPVLTGVKVELTGDTFTFAAADGFRLAVYEGKLSEPVPEDINFIVPARTLQEVNRLLGSQSDAVEFTVTPAKSQALFRLTNIEVVSQLVQGAFPNYRQLVPEDYNTRVVIPRESFMQATRAAATFARDGSGIVRLNITADEDDAVAAADGSANDAGPGSDGKIAVSARADEVGDYAGEVHAQVEGDESKIAFNIRYLTEVLDVLEDSDVALETTASSSPGVIKPAASPNGHVYTHVVMPMFVQW